MLVAVVQAQNMFQFPYYHDEEGTHVANGLAVATDGKLSPYTYSYEDPPAGSMMLAFWTVLTGRAQCLWLPAELGPHADADHAHHLDRPWCS